MAEPSGHGTLAADLDTIARQERALVFAAFDEHIAWSLGCRLRAVAAARAQGVVIVIRSDDHPVFVAALPGSTARNLDWARRKANLVRITGRSSFATGLELQRDGVTLGERFGLDEADHAAHGGSFPIRLSGRGVIGSVTVSGLPQRDDHAAVVAALCAELGRNSDDHAMA